jgi:hypothetical protein
VTINRDRDDQPPIAPLIVINTGERPQLSQ